MPSSDDNNVREPIAVIGMAFQFPGGADTDDKFWDLLMQRRCVSREFPKDRGNIDLYYDQAQTGISKVSSLPSIAYTMCKLTIYVTGSHTERSLSGQ